MLCQFADSRQIMPLKHMRAEFLQNIYLEYFGHRRVGGPEASEVAAMMSMVMRTFFSLGFRKISGYCIRVSLRKNLLLRMCANRYSWKNKFLVRKYPNQVGLYG